jgi:hypothetical protein
MSGEIKLGMIVITRLALKGEGGGLNILQEEEQRRRAREVFYLLYSRLPMRCIFSIRKIIATS